jgi:hypothetical protein
MPSLNRDAAVDASRKLLVCVGGMALTAFVATCHWYLYPVVGAFIGGTWFVLYQIEMHPKRDYIQRVIENSRAFKEAHHVSVAHVHE